MACTHKIQPAQLWRTHGGAVDLLSLPSIGLIHGGAQELSCVSFPEQGRPEHWPDLGVTPVLRQDVCGVDLTW